LLRESTRLIFSDVPPKPPAPPRPASQPVPLDLVDPFDEAQLAEEGPLDLPEETGLEPVPGRPVPSRPATGPAATRGTRRPEDVDGLRLVRPEEWCRVCGTRHESGNCSGELLATGPERYGWRATFETPRGTRETHCVLVAPSNGRWRARILTYPRALWTLPGCPRTIKFVADDPRQVERLARELIEEHCRRRDCKEVRVEVSPLELSSSEREDVRMQMDKEAARRRPRALRVRFGRPGQALRTATTADLSEHGLFIATENTPPSGTLLKIELELPGAKLPLRGTVRWARTQAAPGRPCGIGVQLARVPAIYLHYVRSLP
jgi:hypothetical protein